VIVVVEKCDRPFQMVCTLAEGLAMGVCLLFNAPVIQEHTSAFNEKATENNHCSGGDNVGV
jgi:hypothetical protein